MDGGQHCTCNLPYTDMKVVKVPSFTGASFRYELLCPTCRDSGPFTITSFACLAAFLAFIFDIAR